MKKSLNKVIVTLAAVTALTAAMAVTASAAVTTTQNTTDGKTTVTATVTDKTAGEQVTMLVLKPGADTTNGISEDEIAYIDQKAADADGKVTFTMPIGTTSANEKYELLSGSTSAETAETGEVVIPGASTVVKYGDVTDDGEVDSLDAMQVLYYYVDMDNIINEDEDLLKRADVNKDDSIDSLDAMQILYYYVDMDNTLDDSWMTE